MSRVIVRMWTENGYHKDVAILDEQQIRMSYKDMDAKGRHVVVPPTLAVRVVVDPKLFPEAFEFEVIVEGC